MELHKIILTNFKNYQSQSLDFSKKINCFTGLNGMGKTNLLDAIYYLCMTKSNFSISDRNVLKKGESFFRIEGNVKKDNKVFTIVAKVIPSKSKVFEINKKAHEKLSEHIGLFPIVCIAPDDTDLIKEGSEERRRFLDLTLSQSDHNYLSHLLKYNRILKQRNLLLKELANRNSTNDQLIEVYNSQLEDPAIYLFEKRSEFIGSFSPIFNKFYQLISGGKEEVSCMYKSQLQEDSLMNLLDANLEKDKILQRTTQGVHKDNLIFKINGFPLKRFASQGQMKSFVIALKLAQYEILKNVKNQSPLLILDDIFDKLDNNRVELLLNILLKEPFNQIFISDTEKERVQKILNKFEADFKIFEIENGSIINQ